MIKKVFLYFLLSFISVQVFSQTVKELWVDSVFLTLNSEEKIGQLLMLKVAANSPEEEGEILDRIRAFRIGGVIITQGGPVGHVSLVNKMQEKSKVPLLIGMEADWGAGQTMDSLLAFPKPLVLSSVKNDSLIFRTGAEVARQLKLLGVHLNFGPDGDIDFANVPYPGNLLYYGDNKNRVADKAWRFANGLQANGIIACAKHITKDVSVSDSSFTGTGVFEFGLPDTTNFFPYQHLINKGVGGVLTSHLHYSMLTKHQLSSTLSQLFIGEVIKRKLGFSGLIITEIPELQTTVKKSRGGETEKLAIMVGNDILINPQNISATIKNIKKELRKNKLLQQRLDESVRKILGAKYEAGLSRWKPLDTDNLLLKINSTEARLLKSKLIRESVILLSNNMGHLPVTQIDNRKFASLSIGRESKNEFTHILNKYAPVDHFEIRSEADTTDLALKLGQHDFVVVSVFPFASSFLESVMPAIHALSSSHNVIICYFGDPVQLELFENFDPVIASVTDDNQAQNFVSQMVFGALAPEGELPITVSDKWKAEESNSFAAIDRFSYGQPEEAEMDSKTLQQIADIAREAIDSEATPGCHVLVARHGKVIYDKSFGWLTYENQAPVTDNTLYDLASVSKVAGTLQVVMFLHEKGLIDINKKASVYLPDLIGTNKKDITLKDILTHQSGLLPFIPLWPQTVRGDTLLPEYYSPVKTENYPLQVTAGLYASSSIRDSAWHWTLKSELLQKPPRTPHSYIYSDIGLMILHRLIEKLINQPMNDFLEQNFFEPLGAYTLGYLPLNRYPPSFIAPTENDTLYRRSMIVGTVHDERAAMLGGVAGHAGLFGNANDLAKLGQMLLNGGSYGGLQFFKQETVESFTIKQYENSRRGLGWDKPTQSDWNGPTSLLASAKTFGHTGFTGTCIWVDPEFDLVFIFLSNRVHPYRNGKLLNANIRPRIQEVIYKSVFNYCQLKGELIK